MAIRVKCIIPVQLLRATMRNLRSKLGDDASNPKYIYTEPRVGYRMPRGDTVDHDQSSAHDKHYALLFGYIRYSCC